jgi:hypothetical protein
MSIGEVIEIIFTNLFAIVIGIVIVIAMDTTTTQQFIAGAPLTPRGIAKCGAIEQLDAQFNLDDVHGEIDIRQRGFDVYQVTVDASTEDRSFYATYDNATGEDVVEVLIGLLARTVPDSIEALKGASCSGQSYAWSLIRDVAIERIEYEYSERMAMKYGGRQDIEF